MAQAFTALSASPGARALYDAERARGGWAKMCALCPRAVTIGLLTCRR
jgi:hypothetical protein